jgi:hypothetical protein
MAGHAPALAPCRVRFANCRSSFRKNQSSFRKNRPLASNGKKQAMLGIASLQALCAAIHNPSKFCFLTPNHKFSRIRSIAFEKPVSHWLASGGKSPSGVGLLTKIQAAVWARPPGFVKSMHRPTAWGWAVPVPAQ